VPNSGDPTRYEGVQDQDATSFDVHYWHPEALSPTSDNYKQFWAFPAYPGLLAAVIKGFPATGLGMPWYTCFGNHDGLMQGNAPGNGGLQAIATGPVKVTGLPAGMSPGDFQNARASGDPTIVTKMLTAPARTVTADGARAIVSPQQWIDAHLSSPARPGPKGHGLTDANKTTGTLYYTFTIAPGVLGISLDTVNRGGYADGSIGANQLAWLQIQLGAAKDQLVVLFSHHNLQTLSNPVPDPVGGTGNDPQRVLGPQIETLLHKYPNVVLWVNGHSHVNRIVPHPDPAGVTGGFWEIATAAHVDWPQHARLVELVDNHDGTISIFGTLIDHAAPAATTVGATDVLGLAAISRELSANDFQLDRVTALGRDVDRNVELVLKAPPVSVLSGNGGARVTPVDLTKDVAAAGSRGLPATGWESSKALVAGATALGAAVALRERGRRLRPADASQPDASQPNDSQPDGSPDS
jgi:metallophosphoesterase (TIGR03767 family)